MSQQTGGTGTGTDLDQLAASLGVTPQQLAGAIGAGIAGFIGWAYWQHLHLTPAQLAARLLAWALPPLTTAAHVAAVIAVLALAGLFAGRLARRLKTRHTLRTKATLLPLVPPDWAPAEYQVAAFIIKLHGFQLRNWRRWLDWPAAAFRVLMTHDKDGRPVILWQLPQRHVGNLRRALDSSFGEDVVQLENGTAYLPKSTVGRRYRLEMIPGRRDDLPFRRVVERIDPKSEFCQALAHPPEGELRMVAWDVRGLPASSWSSWIRTVLKRDKKRKPAAERDEAERFEEQQERRAIWRKVADKAGNRDPLFHVQPLALVVSSDRQAGRHAIANLRGCFDQFLSENFLRAVGFHTWGSNAFWRAPGFDRRLQVGFFDSTRVMAGWELGKMLTPPDANNSCSDVVRLEAETAQPPAEAVSEAVAPAAAPSTATSAEPQEALEKPAEKPTTITWMNLPGDRRVTMRPRDLSDHTDLQGPIGTGKSTWMGNVYLSWAELGLPAVVIDPNKGDTIRYLLTRLPERHWGRVILIDAANEACSVGINILDGRDSNTHGVIADQVVSIFGRSYGQYWGPKGASVLRLCILTLLQIPDTTLLDVIPLLTDASVRKAWTEDLTDAGLRLAWKSYEEDEGGEDGERQSKRKSRLEQDAESLIWKLHDVLLYRPVLRNILGQRKSTVDLEQALNGDSLVLISLPTGQIGEDNAAFLGGLLISRMWQIIQARSAVLEEARRHCLFVIDEFPKLVHVATTWEEFLNEGRGYRAPLILGHQARWQFRSAELTHAVDTGTRNKVFLQQEHSDAVQTAPMAQPLTAAQLETLEPRTAVVRLCLANHVKPAFIAAMPPPAAEVSDGERLASRSLERYGTPQAAIDLQLGIGAPPPAPEPDPNGRGGPGRLLDLGR